MICVIYLLKSSFEKKIHHLIYFNLYNISLIEYIFIYTYRGLLFIIKKDKIYLPGGILNIFRIIMWFYLFYINIWYYNIYFSTYNYQYFPIFNIYLGFILIVSPVIIYFLKNNKEKDYYYEYLYNTIFLSIGFIMEIFYFIYPNNNNYEIVKNYIQASMFLLTFIVYMFIPLLKKQNKRKNSNNIEIKRMNIKNIEDIYVKIYETLLD